MPLNRSSITFCLLALLAGFSGLLVGWFGLSLYLSPNLPPVESLREYKYETPLRIYSRDGKLIQEFGEKRSIPIQFDEAPPLLIKAFLAAEDDRFYSHNGVSVRGLLRAASQMVLQSETQTGGSTITQQVAKNFFLSFEKTIIRKLKELLLAFKIEEELEKDQILELYINKIPFGHRAYGVRAAARVYYGKDLSELNLAQLAMIAHMPQRPSDSNPIDDPERALNRRDWILGRMLKLGYIDQASYQDAIKQPVTARYHGLNLDLYAPYIGELVRQEMIQRFGAEAYTAGYKVYTTVDSRMQAAAQRAAINGLLAYDSRHGYRKPDLQLEPIFYKLSEDAQAEKVPENVYALYSDSQENEAGESTDDNPPARHLNLDPWIEELDSIPSYGGLQAAAVLDTAGDNIRALLGDGSIIEIPWESSPSKAREYLQLGTVVRVRPLSSYAWELTQIPEAQAAMVALDPNNGAVLSMVGGFDFSLSNFNRAVQAKRQPGSNFKPFIYTAALLNGFSAASIINDAPIVMYDNVLEKVWRPENYGGKFNGPTRLRKGLYQSTNYIAIRILDSIGVHNAIKEMDRFGFNEAELPKDLTLALGTHVLSPLEVATGYTVFANGGYKVEPHFIQRIEDVSGKAIFEEMPLTVCRECEKMEIIGALQTGNVIPGADILTQSSPVAELSPEALPADGEALGEVIPVAPVRPPVAPRVLDERTAYIMDNILKDVVKEGTGRRARSLGRGDLAGKTGTTNDSVDTWFSGYNQSIVATTWMGFDDNTPLGRSEAGSNATLPIWIEFMQTALQGVKEQHREQPPGIVSVRINSRTGLRTDADDPEAMFEYFKVENVPERGDRSRSFVPSGNEGQTDPDDLF